MPQANKEEPEVFQGKAIERRPSGGLLAGIAAGVASGVGYGAWVWNKLWDFDKELVKRVRSDVRKSTGAGLDNLSGGLEGGLMGGGAIRDFHERTLIEETGSKLAKARKFFGGTLGIGLAVGVAVGAAAAGLYYMLVPKKEENVSAPPRRINSGSSGMDAGDASPADQSKNWQAAVDARKETAASIGSP